MITDRTKLIGELRSSTMAVALRKRQFGRRRAWTDEQVGRAAQVFSADADYLRGTKQLLNCKHDAYRKVLGILSQARTAWVATTIPFPEPGKRLMRRDQLEEFEAKMSGLVAELSGAVDELNAAYPALKEEAKTRLQDLFDESNYPVSLTSEFAIEWEYPSTDPPEYLADLNPALYEAERRKLEAKFDEAIVLAEQAFVAEMQRCVLGLIEKLTPQDVIRWSYAGVDATELGSRWKVIQDRLAELDETDLSERDDEWTTARVSLLEEFHEIESQREMIMAVDIEQRNEKVSYKPVDGPRRITKQFQSPDDACEWLTQAACTATGHSQESRRIQTASIANLTEFFDKFGKMSIRSNSELDALVEQAKAAVEGVDVNALREDGVNGGIRSTLKEAMDDVAQILDRLVVSGGGRQINFADDEE